MPICPEGHQSSESDYCSVCGTPIGAGGSATTAEVRPAGLSSVAPQEPLSASLEATSQACPVCGTVAGPDAFFCEACGYDYLTGSLPRSAQPSAESESDIEHVEALPVSPVSPDLPPAEIVEAEVVDPDAPGAETPVRLEEELAAPQVVDAPAEVEPEPVETPAVVVDEDAGQVTPTEVSPSEELPVEASPVEQVDAPAEFEPIPSQAPRGARPVAEPEPEAVAPAQSQGSYLDLDATEVSHEVDNPLVVESADRDLQPGISAASSLSLGDAGGDVPSPDSLKPLSVPGYPPAGQPAPRPVNQGGPRPGPGRLQPPPGARPYAQPNPGGYRPAVPQQQPGRPFPGPQQTGRPQPGGRPPGPLGGPPRSQPLAAPPQPEPTPDLPVRRPAPEAPPVLPSRDGTAKWVAEIWIDPEWYRVQQAPEQLPSPGQPIIRALRKTTIVIGRSSSGVTPDIDCITDTGVSRRQAALTTDGIRWFVEDLGSSNGTYVGQVDQPMPTKPISGRVELGQHDRIYVGSWTRIVVRPALTQEAGY